MGQRGLYCIEDQIRADSETEKNETAFDRILFIIEAKDSSSRRDFEIEIRFRKRLNLAGI